jgi:hypothetical protein
MAIDTGKILKTFGKKYFDLTGENPSNYRVSKVKVYIGRSSSIKEAFAQHVRSGAEVVVNYREKWERNHCIYARGTALIPKGEMELEL